MILRHKSTEMHKTEREKYLKGKEIEETWRRVQNMRWDMSDKMIPSETKLFSSHETVV